MSTENTNIETASEVVDAAPKDATSTALAVCDRVEIGLATLEADFKGLVFDVSNGAGMEQARKARLQIREVRYTVANAVDEAKKHLNGLKKQIDQRGDAIALRLLNLEEPIHNQIKAEEERKAKEKAHREAEERAARDAILLRLEEIRAKALDLVGYHSALVEKAIAELATIDTASFGEFEPAAQRAIGETAQRLKVMADTARLQEAREAEQQAEAARLAAERREHEEKVAAERAELARQQAELKRQQDEAAAAERHRKEVAEAAERAAKAEQQRKEREAREAVEREAQAQREAAAAAAKREAEIREQAAREMAAARAQMQEAAGTMLVALVSVRHWNDTHGALPDWINDQVDQALTAAGAPAIAPALETVNG